MTTTAAVLGALGLIVLAGMALVAAIAVVVGLLALVILGVVRLVRSRWNGRPVVDEARAAAMRRHPSALGPRTELERLVDLPTEELYAAIDQALAVELGPPPLAEGGLSFAELEHAQRNAEALGRAVDRVTWHGLDEPLVEADLTEHYRAADEAVRELAAAAGVDTELLPRVVEAGTYGDPELVVELYPPAVPPRRPVITNTDEPAP